MVISITRNQSTDSSLQVFLVGVISCTEEGWWEMLSILLESRTAIRKSKLRCVDSTGSCFWAFVFSYRNVTGLNAVVAYTKSRHFGNISGCIQVWRENERRLSLKDMSRDEGYVLADMTPKESIVSYGLIQFHPNHCIEPQIFFIQCLWWLDETHGWLQHQHPWHDWFQRKSKGWKNAESLWFTILGEWKSEFSMQHLTHLSPLFFGLRVPTSLSGSQSLAEAGFVELWIWESRADHMAWFNREAVISTDARFQLSTPPLPKKSDCIFSDTNFGQAKTEASKWNSVSWMQIYISPLLSQKLQLNRWKSQEVGPRWIIETLLSEMIHQ